MRISEVAFQPIQLVKDDPTWRFALGGTPSSDGFLVAIRTADGDVGYGSCAAATYYGWTLGGTKAALETIRPVLDGRDPRHIGPIMVDVDAALPGYERAKAAIEIALHDLVARSLGVSLTTLLGGDPEATFDLVRILALKDPAETARQARGLVEQGYRAIKIKLSGEPTVDIERVRAVRAAVGGEVVLTADANQTYSVKAAIRVLRELESVDLSLIEQPVAADDIRGLAEVRAATTILIEADEAANTLDDIGRLLDARAVDSINLKVAHVGGIRAARLAAGLCAAAGVRCRMGGGTVGSQLVAAATIHLMAATPSLVGPSEVAEWARLSNDPASGLQVVDGRIGVPPGPGLGLDVTWHG